MTRHGRHARILLYLDRLFHVVVRALPVSNVPVSFSADSVFFPRDAVHRERFFPVRFQTQVQRLVRWNRNGRVTNPVFQRPASVHVDFKRHHGLIARLNFRARSAAGFLATAF